MERCCGRTRAGRQCKLNAKGNVLCYDVSVPSCNIHMNDNIIYEWSRQLMDERAPGFIRDYLRMFETCYNQIGLNSRMSLAITAELYTRKDLNETHDLLFEYFQSTLKRATSDQDCPICLRADDDSVETRCGHSFCRKCICDWCLTGKPNCPLCRNKI